MLFDIDPKVIGTRVGSVTVQDVSRMEEAIRAGGIKIAILTVPAQAAQETAERLVDAGVESILNYAPITLMLPENVHVQHIDPVLHLQRMMYYLGERD
jgi:redox-sensing transcriptional repressor